MRHLVFGLAMALLLSSPAISAGPGANAFITNSGSSNVSVIDTVTEDLTAIPVGGSGHGVAMDPKGVTVYVTANGSSSSVYAIDTASKRVFGPFALDTQAKSPFGIAVSPDGKRLFVSHVQVVTIVAGNRRIVIPFGALSAFDITGAGTASVTMSPAIIDPNFPAGTPLRVGGVTTGVAASPLRGGSYCGSYCVYVANGNGSIAVINPANFGTLNSSLVATLNVDSTHGVSLVGLAVSPDGARLYAAGSLRDTLTSRVFGRLWVINITSIGTGTDPVVASVSVGDAPFGVAVSPKHERVFVANSGSNTVSVIDTGTLTDVRGSPFPVGLGPHGVAVTPDGARAYVVNRFDSLIDEPPSLSVLDGTTGAAVKTIRLPLRSNPVGFGVFLTQPLAIDVRIEVIPKVVNRKAEGTVPVVIYGSNPLGPQPFDVHTADLGSITLNGAPVKLKGNGEPMATFNDFDGDGWDDVKVHINMGGVYDLHVGPSDCTAMLMGETNDVNRTHFQGCDNSVKFTN